MAPMDNFHDQVLAIDTQNDHEFRWGWSGDLIRIHEGFSTTIGIFYGSSPRALLARWGAHIQKRAGKPSDGMLPGVTPMCAPRNYRCGRTTARHTGTAPRPVSTSRRRSNAPWQRLDEASVPVHSVELDSWFYQHEVTRKITDVGYLDVVPPTGMTRWEPRADALGPGGIPGLRKRIANRPLVLHGRHISSASSYRQEDALADLTWWVENDRAHPRSPALFQRWMQQASDWGATAYEQDWIVEVWQGVRQLREEPGRIAEWQRMLDDAAKENGIALIWCMATPADMAQAVSLSQVVAVRTSDDYRYAEDAADLWRWHLTVNCIAKSLGQWPFKDVFMSHDNHAVKVDVEGDPNAELESLLSALSAGPVGIGDRLGRTNKEIVMRTCRSDGTLIKPDYPLTAMDRSLEDATSLLWADTTCGEWRYVIAINATRKADAAKRGDPVLKETLDISGKNQCLVYNWKTKSAEVTSTLAAELCAHEWAFWVICPVRTSENEAPQFSVIGDAAVYATMGDRRIRVNKPFTQTNPAVPPSMDVVGVPGEKVSVTYWLREKGICSLDVTIGALAWTKIEFPVC